MKKRLLSLALVLALALSFAVPAAAATQSTDELTQVTLAVKAALDIGDEYEDFSSNITDLGVTKLYDLSWSSSGEDLQVNVRSDGTIYSYYHYIDSDSTYEDGYAVSFPDATQAQIQAAAQEFLAKVLPEGQSAELEDANLYTSQQTEAYLNGTLTINGVPTDVGLELEINLATLSITYYYRDDSWQGVYLGDVPSATPAVTADAAKETLRGVQTLELRYVQDDEDNIVLRYVPVTEGNWYVDAQTGEAVDLSVWDGIAYSADMATEESATEAEGSSDATSLSYEEQASIDQMAGTLDADTLDAKLRQYDALGLAGMTRTGASYQTNSDTGEITCRLTYTRALARDEVAAWIDDDSYEELSAAGELILTKRIKVDAVDGSILSLYTNDTYAKSDYDGDGQAVAESFLSEAFPEAFAQSALEDTEDSSVYYNYVRTANDVPYYRNYLNVSVCAADGSIGSFSTNWDEDAQFPATDAVIGMDAAMDAYLAQYEAVLQYTSSPVTVDTSDAEWATYSEQMGSATAYEWVLSYVLDADNACYGVDALTGEALCHTGSVSAKISYTDLAQSYAKDQIEALAAYGVGFGAADTFQPTKQLTQKEALVLLVNATGYYSIDVEELDEEQLDTLYTRAKNRGLITEAERDPDALVTRLDFLKMLIGASNYGKAAQLTGIYKTTFSDEASIAESDLGYAAIAEALDLVNGDENHALNPNRVATRQEAAIILYNYMSRSK